MRIIVGLVPFLLLSLLQAVGPGELLAVEKTVTLPGNGVVEVGGRAPPLSSWDTGNALVRLSEILRQGDTRGVLVSFYASWCSECPKGLRMLEEEKKRLEEAGVRVLLVNHGEDVPTIEAHRTRMKLTLPVVTDEFKEIGRSYGVRFLPASFLVGQDGKVRAIYTYEGKDFVERILRDATAE